MISSLNHPSAKTGARFKSRRAAGKALADQLRALNLDNAIVLGLTRGGVEVAAATARWLNAPLGAIIVAKIGHPMNPEYAVGAVTEHVVEINQNEVALLHSNWFRQAVGAARRLISRRKLVYKTLDLDVRNKTVILVDDGIATGLSMRAAIKETRWHGAKQVILAVPIVDNQVLNSLRALVDTVVVLVNPELFKGSVGAHYENFNQVSDLQVTKLLKEASHG